MTRGSALLRERRRPGRLSTRVGAAMLFLAVQLEKLQFPNPILTGLLILEAKDLGPEKEEHAAPHQDTSPESVVGAQPRVAVFNSLSTASQVSRAILVCTCKNTRGIDCATRAVGEIFWGWPVMQKTVSRPACTSMTMCESGTAMSVVASSGPPSSTSSLLLSVQMAAMDVFSSSRWLCALRATRPRNRWLSTLSWAARNASL